MEEADLKSWKLLQGWLLRGLPSPSSLTPRHFTGTPHGPTVPCLGIPHPRRLPDPASSPAFHLGCKSQALFPQILNPSGLTPESSSRVPAPGTPIPSEDSHDFLTPSPGNPLHSEVMGADENLALPKNLRRHKSRSQAWRRLKGTFTFPL